LGTRKRINKNIIFAITIAIIAIIGIAPLYLKTQSYPIAIVEGSSMYPTLQNGDMVIFHGIPNPNSISNKTIIVFVQGDTGVSLLDTLTKPVVIHRVIGTVLQADGTVYYQTKGDNNGLADPSLTQANHVLGTPVVVIPKVGLFFIFIQSPQGLVATVGFLTLFYLSNYESKLLESKKKDKLLSQLSKKVTGGSMSMEEFRKFEMAVKYPVDEESHEKIVDFRPLIKKLKLGGWNVKPLATVSGLSGTDHQFDLAIFSKQGPEQPVIAIDIDAREDAQCETAVLTMFAKVFDTNVPHSILVSTRSYDENTKNLAKNYHVIVIDSVKPNQISDLLQGAVTAILENHKPPVKEKKIEDLAKQTLQRKK